MFTTQAAGFGFAWNRHQRLARGSARRHLAPRAPVQGGEPAPGSRLSRRWWRGCPWDLAHGVHRTWPGLLLCALGRLVTDPVQPEPSL